MAKNIGVDGGSEKRRLALDRRQLKHLLDSLTSECLFEFAHDLQTGLDRWQKAPSATSFDALRSALPVLEKMLDFDVVWRRLDSLGPPKPRMRGADLALCVPELVAVQKALLARIGAIPPSIQKAEWCLRPIALRAGADSNVEAAVYFASRGKPLVDADALSRCWRRTILEDLRRRANNPHWPETIRTRLKSDHLSLAELARLGYPTFFFPPPYRADSLAESAMYRAAEWFELAGFEPWLANVLSELFRGPEFSFIYPREIAWTLLCWCRSNLALKTADRMGLETWLRGLSIGERDRSQPWRVFWGRTGAESGMRDYLPVAAIIAFAWHRIKPQHLQDDVLRQGVELLLESQMSDGGWPLLLGDSRSSVLSTALVVHALCLHQPAGWQRLAARAGEWLLTQQQKRGLWRPEEKMDPVWLAVLVLDALELASGGSELTFGARQARTTEGRYVFRQDGDGFAIVFEGRRLPAVSNLVGLRYLHLLLEHEGTDLDVLALRQLAQRAVTAPAPTLDELADQEFVGGLEGNLGEIMDDRGEKLLRKEAERLKGRIEEARAFERDDDVVRLTQELDELGEQVRAARGLAGRKRVSGSPTHRARTSVLHAITDALDRLKGRDLALHDHLKGALTTGTICRYAPDHSLPWHLR